jgi:hypothetical protein
MRGSLQPASKYSVAMYTEQMRSQLFATLDKRSIGEQAQ